MKIYMRIVVITAMFLILNAQSIADEKESLMFKVEKDLTHYKSFLEFYYYERLDMDRDGRVSLKDFRDFWESIDPEAEEFSLEDAKKTFDIFDINGSGFIELSELEKYTPSIGDIWQNFDLPTEIHISLTNDTSIMQVMWVTPLMKFFDPFVKWGTSPLKMDNQALGTYHTYNVGHMGFHGNIYVAYMINLSPLTRYYYQVGDKKIRRMSPLKLFKSPPSPGQQVPYINFAIFGDMGTVIPFGGPISKMITKDNYAEPYNFTVLVGDIAYAGVSSEKQGEIEPIWDLFGIQIEPWASTNPFIPGVGNHEKYYNYTSYKNRYILPQQPGSQGNFWTSFEYASVHITLMSTENDYFPGSEQYQFLENDLMKASQNPNIKWIFFGGHRPMLCSDADQYDAHKPGCRLLVNLEPLLNKYKVDLVLNGHQHCYERTYPFYKDKVIITEGSTENVYLNPQAPVYMTQGTAGALMRERWIKPIPEWSAKRYERYGYGRIRIHDNGTLHYQSLDWPDKIGDEFWVIKNQTRSVIFEQ